jgi:hypothetical protein
VRTTPSSTVCSHTFFSVESNGLTALNRTLAAWDAAVLQSVPIAPWCTADGLIHVARGLIFRNVVQIVIERERSKCQWTYKVPELALLR